VSRSRILVELGPFDNTGGNSLPSLSSSLFALTDANGIALGRSDACAGEDQTRRKKDGFEELMHSDPPIPLVPPDERLYSC
jgi:hypothetical protein